MYIIIIIIISSSSSSSSSGCGRVQSESSNGNILCVLIMLTKSIWIVIVRSVKLQLAFPERQPARNVLIFNINYTCENEQDAEVTSLVAKTSS